MELKDYGYELMEVSKLVKADWNYKEDDEKKLNDLVNNIKRNGQVENLIVRKVGEKFEIVNGNHRYDALKELKIKKAIVCNKGEISKPEAMRLAVETNETRFPNDNVKLAGIVSSMVEEFEIEDLSGTLPFTAKEIENFQSLLDFDWEQYENETGIVSDDFNKKIVITVNQDMLDRWNELKKKLNEVIGYDNESKVFEFAVIEALNIPVQSLR